MNANDYQTAAARTLISAPEAPFAAEELQLILGAIKLVVKAGKVAEYVKKAVCHRHGFDQLDLNSRLIETAISAQNLLLIENQTAPELIFSGAEQMMLWCALGLGGEAGEVLESVSLFDANMLASFDDLSNELGDCAWYAAALCTLAKIDLGSVLAENIAKLEKRYPNGYSSTDSQARVDLMDAYGDVLDRGL